MKTIPLTKSDRVVLVDDEDFARVSQHQWSLVTPNEHLAYAARQEKGQMILLHRVITSAPPKVLVDHKDKNGLNNQRGNLRLCSYAENVRNKRKHVQRFSSQFKGVHQIPTYSGGARHGKPRAKPWVAQVTFEYRKFTRFFKTELEAARGYDDLAREFHGEFACLNLA